MGHHRLQGYGVLLALLAAQQDLQLLLGVRVADADAHDEAVELRFRQRVGAFELHWILRRDHDKRRVERKALALDGYLALLHRFEQRRLRLRSGAIDLVAEQQIGEQRPAPELELRLALVVDVAAGDLARQQVGGELDAAVRDVQHLGEGVGYQRLGESGVVLDQDVAVGEDAHQHLPEHPVLAYDHLRHGVDHPFCQVAYLP